MSDARNSSGNIRGGGARLTGGGGRTHKKAVPTGGAKALNGLLGESAPLDKKELAKQHLQMLTMSKQLAIMAQEACFAVHTEEEYKEMHVPIPDADAAMKKLKAMATTTKDWYDKDFRERWLKDVFEVWEKELKAEFEEAARARAYNASLKQKKEQRGKENGVINNNNNASKEEADGAKVAVSTEELEAMLQNPEITGEERKKLKKKLQKRRKQKNDNTN